MAVEKAESFKLEGTELLQAGDFAKAIAKYDEGLLALIREPADAEAVKTVRLALHLNSSLAHLKRSNFGAAVDHATAAIGIDSQNTKAYFRRGQALSAIEGEKENAILDLQKALELEPWNKEVQDKLSAMKGEPIKPTVPTKQRNTAADKEKAKAAYKKMFSEPIYDETSAGKPEAVFRPFDCAGNVVLSAKDVSFEYEKGLNTVKGVNLDLKSGHCVGMFGMNGAGKTTLLKIMAKELEPNSGSIILHSDTESVTVGAQPLWLTLMLIGAGVYLAIASVCAVVLNLNHPKTPPQLKIFASSVAAMDWRVSLSFPIVIGIVGLIDYIWRSRRRQASKKAVQKTVAYITSENAPGQALPEHKTIEETVGEFLPEGGNKKERVIKLLEAAGFQMYDQKTSEKVGNPREYVKDGVKMGILSGGQRHLMHVLRQLAANPQVLLLDEVLGGLDIERQPRVLHMLKRLQRERNVAILYNATELHQLRVVADSIAYVHEGEVVEYGSADDVLDRPSHPKTKGYVSDYRTLPKCEHLGGYLAQSYGVVQYDQALLADWLP